MAHIEDRLETLEKQVRKLFSEVGELHAINIHEKNKNKKDEKIIKYNDFKIVMLPEYPNKVLFKILCDCKYVSKRLPDQLWHSLGTLALCTNCDACGKGLLIENSKGE